MTSFLNRRHFLKTTGGGIGMGLTGCSRLWAAETAHGVPNAEKLGWRLGCQTWTFHLFSLFDAIDKTASLGLHYLESGAGMQLDKSRPGIVLSEDSPDAVRDELKKKLANSGVKLISYWPSAYSKNVAQCRKTFEFAKDMGIEMLAGEPPQEAFDTLDKLCEEYKMSLAVHNHPKPSCYWNPETVLKVCRGHSKWIGACADTGHWLRSGLNPLECLKKLEGRISSLHLKDLNQSGPNAHDVPWGTGACDVKGMLTEIHRQGIKPPSFIEYEYKWENNLPEIAKSITYFNKVAAELT